MKKIGSIFFMATILLLVMWQLPWMYSFLVSKKDASPFIIYSTLCNDFIISSTVDSKRVHQDTEGTTYLQNQVDSLLPFFFARQLLKDERFPDSVKGVAVNYRDSQHESFVWKSAPKEMNAPQIGIYQLMESSSQRVQLETPPDVFRITQEGMEFIDIETNQLNPEKSASFTEVMKKKGFAFPASYLSGNPSVKKEYDQGYLVLDSKQALFHIKQVVGRPFVRKIEVPDGVELKYTFITEHRNKRTIGYASDAKNQLYVIELPSYQFKRVEIPSFNPEEEALMIYGNQMDWTLKLASRDRVVYYAIDADDYALIKAYEPPYESSFGDRFGDFLTATGVRFTSPLDKFVRFRIGL